MGDLVVCPRRVQNGLGENADVLLVFTSQSEERKRIDELIESGKEEGMKVRAAAPQRRPRQRGQSASCCGNPSMVWPVGLLAA